MNAGNRRRTMCTKTRFSLSISPRNWRPIRPTTADMARMSTIQLQPMIWLLRISCSDLMDR